MQSVFTLRSIQKCGVLKNGPRIDTHIAAVCNSTHVEISGAHNKCTAFKYSDFDVCDLEHSYNDGAS